ncbi:cytochrome P450 84A1-like [Oryza glaberrima]|uniref:Cytochrome P450 n=1 Tax=Oryza glaberrima TaxID=4538 RepID=I1P6T3_ORYGL|nr:cytochrome P450 84A1-like [Oryza glaberrima]
MANGVAEYLLLDPWLVLWLVLASMAFALLHLRRRARPPLPPGPRPLPIIGNMLMMDQLTHRGLAAMAARYGGLLHLRLGRVHMVVVSSPEHAREVLQVQDGDFSNRPASIAIAYLTYGRADMAFSHYGHFWRQVRKLSAVRLFSRRRAQSWRAVRDESAKLVGAMARSASAGAGEAVDLGELIFGLTKDVIFRAAFGTRDGGGHGELEVLLQEFSRLFGAFNVGDFIPWLAWLDPHGINRRLRAARAALDGVIDRIIDEHVSNPAGDEDADMVDDMLAFLDEAGRDQTGGGGGELQGTLRLTRDNVKAIIMDFVFGGTETVASAIEWAMAELLHSPGDLRRLQAELADVVGLGRGVEEGDLEKLPFLRCVAMETLRLHPPIPLLLHEAAADCVVGGYSVPRGARVVVNVWSVGRDPGAWKGDAGAFRPARFMAGGEAAGMDLRGGCFELLPFGSGRRACPAIVLGMYELELVVARLVHAFGWAPPGGVAPEELDMADGFGLTAPRAARLRAVPTPRLTCPM